MKKDEKKEAPLEAYYAAPPTILERLRNISEWTVIDKVILSIVALISVSHIVLEILKWFVIKGNWIVDGLLVISTWLLVTAFAWWISRADARETSLNRTKLATSSALWKLLFLVLAICIGVWAFNRTNTWISEHSWRLNW